MLDTLSGSPAHPVLNFTAPAARPQDILTPSTLSLCTLRVDPGQWYFRYVPPMMKPSTPLLVCVHGVTRNAWEIATTFVPYCERYAVAMVAPVFSKDRHRHYQLMAPERSVARSDEVLLSIVSELQQQLELRSNQVSLFGYSGGSQFVHRFAFAYPERVKRIVLGAAGWYTLPDPSRAYPHGVGPSLAAGTPVMDPAKFLRIPARVLVGERDTERDAKLNQSPEVDACQGTTRLERATCWVRAMQRAAEGRGYDTSYELRIIPRANHSFARCARHGLAESVFGFLFGRGLQ